MPIEPTKKIHELRLLAVVLLLITALAEMFLVRTLYYTVGEVAQLLHGLLVLLNVPLFVIALLPVVQLVIFGYAIRTDVTDVRLAVVDPREQIRRDVQDGCHGHKPTFRPALHDPGGRVVRG